MKKNLLTLFLVIAAIAAGWFMHAPHGSRTPNFAANQPVAGAPIYFASPSGKLFALIAIDHADGNATATIEAVK